jgi:hypothetical protein
VNKPALAIDEAFGGRDPTELQENVPALLEKAKLPQAACDTIVEMVQEAEQALAEPDPDDARDERMDREADVDWRWANDWE